MGVEVDIEYKPLAPEGSSAVYSLASWERLKERYWPNEQGTNVRRIETLLWNVLYKNLLLYHNIDFKDTGHYW